MSLTHKWVAGSISGVLALGKPFSLSVSIIGLSLILRSLVGVGVSALGGVRLKKLESTPTGGGRPRGKRKLSDTLARFCNRQSDNIDIVYRLYRVMFDPFSRVLYKIIDSVYVDVVRCFLLPFSIVALP